MKEFLYGYYATRIYLPLSSLSRRWRRFIRRKRNKKSRFLQTKHLPIVHWSRCTNVSMPQVWEQKKLNGNVRISELAILSALAASCEDSTNIFEIGTFDGRTTINLALNSRKKCMIYTLDLPQYCKTKFDIDPGERHTIDKPKPGARYDKYRDLFPFAVGKIHQLLGDSATFDYSPYRDSCSLVFVDGSHTYEYAKTDTHAAMNIVKENGVIIWHDYGIWEGVTRALEEFEELEHFGLRNIGGTSLVYWKKS
jgi:hypothetical protein